MSHFYKYPTCAIETNLFVQFANKNATEFAEKELSSLASTLLYYFSSSQEFIQTLGEEVAKKVAVKELHRGVSSTDYVYIDMLFIQEEQDEDDDANAPPAISVSFLSQKCQVQLHQTLPNLHWHLRLPKLSLRLKHIWDIDFRWALIVRANVDTAAECHRGRRTGVVILETVPHLVHAFASNTWIVIICNFV